MTALLALGRAGLLLVLAVASGAAGGTAAQTVSVRTAGGHLSVHAPHFDFLKGPALARLQDGRSVRIELTLMILPAPGKPAAVTVRRLFGLSYDLWEERLAVTTIDAPRRTISHVTAADAEAWCLEHVSTPLSALASVRRGDGAFWIRLEYRMLDTQEDAGSQSDAGFTLQGLIDVLSRRRLAESGTMAVEAGPFPLPAGGGL